MDVRSELNQVEIVVPVPSIEIQVASGVNGRRGSYTFVGTAANPNFVADDSVITGNPDIYVQLYDIYISVTTGKQWQYLVGSDGNPQWYIFQSGSATGTGGFKQSINTSTSSSFTITHNLNTYDIIVTVYAIDSPRIDVGAYIERIDTNTVNVRLQVGAGDPQNYMVLISTV